MLRGLVVWILLLPILSNGLWIVCSGSSETTAAGDSVSQAEKDCIRICLKKYAAEFGNYHRLLQMRRSSPHQALVIRHPT